MRPAVIAVGNRWRGDDAIGPTTLDKITPRLPASVDTIELDGEPTRLVDAWTGRPWVVVIDAVHDGSPAGALHRIDGLSDRPLSAKATSTHGSGVAEAIAIGEAIERLPARLVVLGIEPATMRPGDDLSDEVAAALEALADAVLEEVAVACA